MTPQTFCFNCTHEIGADEMAVALPLPMTVIGTPVTLWACRACRADLGANLPRKAVEFMLSTALASTLSRVSVVPTTPTAWANDPRSGAKPRAPYVAICQ